MQNGPDAQVAGVGVMTWPRPMCNTSLALSNGREPIGRRGGNICQVVTNASCENQVQYVVRNIHNLFTVVMSLQVGGWVFFFVQCFYKQGIEGSDMAPFFFHISPGFGGLSERVRRARGVIKWTQATMWAHISYFGGVAKYIAYCNAQ